ncbi:MAG: DUF5686 family protein [Bacteroidales bacterium]|nr:DUF5686 family protein [Bacteroidales bacterium]
MKRFAFTVILALITLLSYSQHALKGKIVDSKTGAPLPFVNIVYNEHGQGVTTELDGTFRLNTPEPVQILKLSYVGYSVLSIDIKQADYAKPINIGMQPLSYQIEEVTVRPGVNPAHRIIKSAYANSKTNNPEQLKSFRYNSYNKMFFTFKTDSIDVKTKNDSTNNTKIDSLSQKIKSFSERQHLFMMESVTERNFKYPSSNNEKVLATRVSGLKDPFFVFLATQFQSFSFYNEQISLGGKDYLNPISKGSTSRYLFLMEDTLYTQDFDTLFVISFRPLRNQNFSALKGVLNINSKGYAIQNVIAQPVEPPSPLFTLKIQQRYQLIDSLRWFPIELSMDIYLDFVNAQAKDTIAGQRLAVKLVGIGNSYIKNIDLNPSQKNRDFNHIELTFDPMSGEKDDEYWLQFRNDTLNTQEQRTYQVIDSLGAKINLDKQIRTMETLITGHIPIKSIDIDINRFLGYNRFEGYRLGLGLKTNKRLTKWVTLGGYYAYGFKDKGHKYGGFGRLNLNQKHQVSIEGIYEHDVREPGELNYKKPYGLINSDIFRNILIWKMDYLDQYTTRLNFRILKHFTIGLSANQMQFNTTSGYGVNHQNLSTPNNFTTNELGAEIKFVWKEIFMETPRGLLPLGFGYPLIWLNYHRGISSYGGNFSYNRIAARFDYQIKYRTIGSTNITVNGGLLSGEVPTPLLQFAPGGNGKYPLDGTSSFATMNLYEFVSDQYAYLFLRHNFGQYFWKPKSKFFKPKVILVQNIAFGSYASKTMHNFTGGQPKSLDKGFFESGILVNGLLSNALNSVGLGVYYRWGDYAHPTWQENLALKLTFSIDF